MERSREHTKSPIEGIKLLYHNFWQINFFKSIYYNLRLFGVLKGYKLPILIGHHVKIYQLGKIIIPDDATTGMVSLGVLSYKSMDESGLLKLNNSGEIYFYEKAKIHPSAKIHVGKNGVLIFKGKNTIGSNSRIVCWKKIEIGWNSGCSWDCQIFDTDFHFLYDMMAQRPLKRTSYVMIGDNVFIGNHCNIGKGTKLSNGTVVSSYCKVSGNYMKKGENLLLSGPSAQIIGEKYTMTHAWDTELEKQYSIMLKEPLK